MTSTRRRLAFIAATLAAAFASGALQAQEIPTHAPLPPMPAKGTKLPNVVLMSMGGTIASRGTPRLNVSNYGGKGVPRVDPSDWVHDLPELAGIANVTLDDQRAPQDRASSETFEDWQRVAKRLNALAADPGVDGIVVTHGTNTMAETAYYMNLTVKTKKPIVFVGSQRPWTGLSGDGPRNLYDAVRVAASKEAWDKGVLHCMNQLVTPAREVNKLSAYRVQTFRGIDSGAIGVADPDTVKFYREPTRRHTDGSEFAGTDFSSLPAVEVAYAYRDAPGYLIDAMVEHGAKGIVIDGTGAGSLHDLADRSGGAGAEAGRDRRRHRAHAWRPRAGHRASTRRAHRPRRQPRAREGPDPAAARADARRGSRRDHPHLQRILTKDTRMDLTRRDFNRLALGTAAAALATHPAFAGAKASASDVGGPASLTLSESAEQIRSGKLTSTELTKACLDRIEVYQPKLDAFITVLKAQALAQAAQLDAEAKAGKIRGPLHGVPLGIKDIIDTAGARTTGGSSLFSDRVPDEDATVVARLRGAGAVIIGKTNTQEFAMGGGDSSYYYAARNPWNLAHNTGGSSSGSGAAIAAFLCQGALGTDTGGSVRMPASFCGIVGLKGTYGLVPIKGIMPLTLSLDHCGPMTRTVKDTALMLGVMAGYDKYDITSVDHPKEDYLAALTQPVKGLRLGLPAGYFDDLHPEVAAATEAAIALLGKLTAGVKDCALPGISHLANVGGLGETLAWHEEYLQGAARQVHAERTAPTAVDHGREAARHRLHPREVGARERSPPHRRCVHGFRPGRDADAAHPAAHAERADHAGEREQDHQSAHDVELPAGRLLRHPGDLDSLWLQQERACRSG